MRNLIQSWFFENFAWRRWIYNGPSLPWSFSLLFYWTLNVRAEREECSQNNLNNFQWRNIPKYKGFFVLSRFFFSDLFKQISLVLYYEKLCFFLEFILFLTAEFHSHEHVPDNAIVSYCLSIVLYKHITTVRKIVCTTGEQIVEKTDGLEMCYEEW